MLLKEAREARRVTQQEMADHLGMSRPTYRRYEESPGEMSVEDARRAAEFLGLEPVDIFFAGDCKETYSEGR